ncbi:MAG: hypothetical protein ACRD1I_05825 [Terriglobia bacterium]
MMQILIWDVVKFLVALVGLVYAILVYTAYEIEGSRYQPRFQLTKPARSGERLLIWTGVRVLDAMIRFIGSALNQLFAASAEVGDWAVEKASPSVQRKVRSKFL